MGRYDFLRRRKITESLAHQLNLFFILFVLLLPYPASLVAAEPGQSSGYSFTSPYLLLHDHGYSLVCPALASSAPIAVSWTTYHDYESLTTLVLAFNTSYPGLVEALVIGKTWEGRDIFCVRITDEGSTDSGKQQILVVAEHHAREVITQEAALYMIWYLLTNYQTDLNIQYLLISKEIYVIPCLNPDGMEAALTYNPFQRKNMRPIDDDNDGSAVEDVIMDLNQNGQLECYEVDTNVGTSLNPAWVMTDMAFEGNATNGDAIQPGFVSDNPGGVDLNRNYGYHFNDTFEMSSNSTNPRVEDYKGSAPFSEPETLAVKQLVESHSFIFAMSLHSGTETLLRPWSYTTEVLSLGANCTLFNAFGEAFEQSSGYSYWIGTGNIGYNTSGEFMDWMYGEKKIPTMTCEIYGDQSAYRYSPVSPNGDRYIWWGVWDFFNPPSSMIESVCEKTLEFLLQVSSINGYISLRTSSIIERSMVFVDGHDSLNLTWTYGDTQDIAIVSHTFLPFETRTNKSVKPAGNIFLVFSDRPVHDLQLSLDYSEWRLNAMSIDEKDLSILTWNATEHEWIKLEPIEMNTEENRITVIVETDMIMNTPYYFMLGSVSSWTLQPISILQIVLIFGATLASVAGLVILRHRGKAEREPRQTQESLS